MQRGSGAEQEQQEKHRHESVPSTDLRGDRAGEDVVQAPRDKEQDRDDDQVRDELQRCARGPVDDVTRTAPRSHNERDHDDYDRE